MVGNFYEDSGIRTGRCAVVVYNKDRSLCADLAAACKYSPDHLAVNMDIFDNVSLVYLAGFFITSSPESLMKVGQTACAKNIPFCFNLSATFLLQFELANVM